MKCRFVKAACVFISTVLFEIIGVYSDDAEAMDKLNKEFGVYAMKSYDEFVDVADGIIVTARHGDNHYKYAKPYIESGIPMFIDKPITCSEEDALKLKAALIKNNITRRALKECGVELDDALVGPTAVIIAQDEYLPALKAIYKYSKSNDFYKIKGGVLEGKVSSVEELTTLAQLPSREELIAKLAGCLLANVSKLAATLDAVRVKKESEAAE